MTSKSYQQRKIFEPTLDAIIEKYKGKPGELLSILEDIQEQDESNHLSREVLGYISRKLDIPLSKLYSVVTFYSLFNLEPQGKHTITVCRGTACHTRGSDLLLRSVTSYLGFSDNDVIKKQRPSLTTKDHNFTLRTVACFGQCALAPVVEIDKEVHGHISTEKLKGLVETLKKKRKTAGKIKKTARQNRR